MEKILEKLKEMKDYEKRKGFNNWNLEEQKQLLEIYYIISKKESHILNLIYSYHGCDSYEDIFRDYKKKYLEDKAEGVEIAIEEIMEQIKRGEHKNIT